MDLGTRRAVRSAAFVGLCTAIVIGCSSTSSSTSSSGTSGGTSGTSGGTSGTSGGTSGSSGGANLCCSINGKAYDCPNQSAATKCTDPNTSDPSGCSSRASACPTGSSSGSTSSGSTNLCCGYNNSYYDCPTTDALLNCGKGDSSGCTSRATKCS